MIEAIFKWNLFLNDKKRTLTGYNNQLSLAQRIRSFFKRNHP